MVYGAVSRIAAQGIRSAGIYLIPRVVKTFTKYDKAIFRNLYGKSGGRGVRHGRDIGAAVGGLLALGQGDDLDNGVSQREQYSSRSKPKARGRRSNKYNISRSNYCADYRGKRKSSNFRRYTS